MQSIRWLICLTAFVLPGIFLSYEPICLDLYSQKTENDIIIGNTHLALHVDKHTGTWTAWIDKSSANQLITPHPSGTGFSINGTSAARRLGRTVAHLIQLVADLEQRQVGLVSLNDPVDTTTAQGRLVFRIFASLAEFEREVIRERTLAGLASARRRGKLLGRPKGLSKSAERKACIAESLYMENIFSVEQIAQELSISKTTLYKYLRNRGVQVGVAS